MRRWVSSFATLLIGFTLLTTAYGVPQQVLKPLPAATSAQLYNPQLNMVFGNPKGSITLVEFFDYNCPYCRHSMPMLEALIKQNPNLRVVFKEYLLFGDTSIPATSAALAASNQNKYSQMHYALLTAKNPLTKEEVLRIAKSNGLNTVKLAADMDSNLVKQQIAANTKLVDTLGITAAPAFIVANTAANPKNSPQYLYVGIVDAPKNLQQIIDKLSKG